MKRSVFSLLIGLALQAPIFAALAMPELDVTQPVGDWWMHNASEAIVRAKMNEGYRVMRVNKRPDGPDRFTATFVHNSGAYLETGTQWLPDLTQSEFDVLKSDAGKRIVDVDLFISANNEIHFSAVWVGNTGTQQKTAKTLWVQSIADVRAFSDPANFRIVDLEYINHPVFGPFYMALLVQRETGNERCQYAGEGTIEDINNKVYAVETDASGVPCGNYLTRLVSLENIGADKYAYVVESRLNAEQPWWFADLNFSGIARADVGPQDRIPDPAAMTQMDNLGTLADRLQGRFMDIKAYAVGAETRYLALVTDNVPYPQSEARTTPNATLDALDAAVQKAMKKFGVPGATLAVMDGPRLVYAQGYGFSHIARGDPRKPEPVTPKTLFRVASVSKAITTLALLRLIQDAVPTPLTQTPFTLNTRPWVDIFPCKTADYDLCATMDPALKDLTIRQLMQHKSFFHDDLAWAGSEKVVMEHAIPAVFVDIDAAITANPLASKYMNGNYHILERVIELVSGLPYETYYKQKLLDPVGITRMRIGHPHAEGYTAAAPIEAALHANVTRHNRRSWDAAAGAYKFQDPAESPDWMIDGPVRAGATSWAAAGPDILRLLCAVDGSCGGTQVLDNWSLVRTGTRADRAIETDPVVGPTVAAQFVGLVNTPTGGPMALYHNGYVPHGANAEVWVRDDGIKFFLAFNGDVANGYNQTIPGGTVIQWSYGNIGEVRNEINAILNAQALPAVDQWTAFSFTAASGPACGGIAAWQPGTYAGGAKAQSQGSLYQCKSFPQSGWCGQVGYAPGVDAHWADAWNTLGACATGAVGGSPLQACNTLPEWNVQAYTGGDRVKHGGVTYTCKGWPQSGWCGQAGYEPGVTRYWQDAWIRGDACASQPPPPPLQFMDANHPAR